MQCLVIRDLMSFQQWLHIWIISHAALYTGTNSSEELSAFIIGVSQNVPLDSLEIKVCSEKCAYCMELSCILNLIRTEVWMSLTPKPTTVLNFRPVHFILPSHSQFYVRSTLYYFPKPLVFDVNVGALPKESCKNISHLNNIPSLCLGQIRWHNPCDISRTYPWHLFVKSWLGHTL